MKSKAIIASTAISSIGIFTTVCILLYKFRYKTGYWDGYENGFNIGILKVGSLKHKNDEMYSRLLNDISKSNKVIRIKRKG